MFIAAITFQTHISDSYEITITFNEERKVYYSANLEFRLPSMKLKAISAFACEHYFLNVLMRANSITYAHCGIYCFFRSLGLSDGQ